MLALTLILSLNRNLLIYQSCGLCPKLNATEIFQSVLNEQEHSSFRPSQDNELRVWAFRRSMFSRRIAEAEDLLQLLTTMSCGQNCFSNVDMPMKLTAH